MKENREDCIIFFSNSNYIKQTGGTEKFLSNTIRNLIANHIHSVQIFPVRRINHWIKKLISNSNVEFVAINIDERYFGTFTFAELYKILNKIELKYKFSYQGVIINQMNYFDKKILAHQLNKLSLPVKYIVHDFTAACPYIFWGGKTGNICESMVVKPNKEQCGSCNYLQKAMRNYSESEKFFQSIEKLIDHIICPSSNACENWKKLFSDKYNVAIRPHLKYEYMPIDKSLKDKIRVAFIGQPAKHKGIEEWNQLTTILDEELFELYYLGTSDLYKSNSKIKTVKVDYRDKNSLTMQQQLSELNIDIVFQWSKCQETYSYTYFEAFEAGCFIVTNRNSGNIAEMISQQNNGKVFKSFEDCKDWFLSQGCHNDVLNYYNNGNKICHLKPNADINDFIFKDNIRSRGASARFIVKNPILYLLGMINYLQL